MTTATDEAAPMTGQNAGTAFDVEQIRRDFPILAQTVKGHPLAYLDNAATAQKPQSVIDALVHHYATDNANIHRGVHQLSVRSTQAYEDARIKCQKFIGAARPEEIIFVRGATEAVNLVAHTFGRSQIGRGDEILISTLEHHSNIVPWQILCEEIGATLKVAPVDDRGELLLDAFEQLLGPKTKLVAVTHVSNAIGTITPVRRITELAHAVGAKVLIDGAQAAPHLTIDVGEIGCDFYAVSSHKVFGPTGVGILYGRFDLLDTLPPYQAGGEMIKSVTFEQTIYNDLPHRFEAGTPNIAGAVGMGAAVDYVTSIGMDAIAAYEHELLTYATKALTDVPHVRLIGTAREKAAVLSFVIEGVHPHDVGTILDQRGVAIRTGHHCAQPLIERFLETATCRASLAFYNTVEEVDALVAGLRHVVEVFA